MIRKILKLFGYKIIYKCQWGEYDYMYDQIDRWMVRPIHSEMSVAPPWAKRYFVRI